jgi:hypothetical protein
MAQQQAPLPMAPFPLLSFLGTTPLLLSSAQGAPIPLLHGRRPAAALRSAAAPSPPHLPHKTAPAASHRRPWPSPIPPWPPSSLSRAPRNFQQRATLLRCCRTSLLLPHSLIAQRAPPPTCAASCALQQPWRPTSLRSGADPKQRPRIPSAPRASLDLRSAHGAC